MLVPSTPPSLPTHTWLAFHIRRLRKWRSERGISQIELAERSGVPARTLRNLESSATIPKPVDSLLRVAIALNTSIENLVDPRHFEMLRQRVEGPAKKTPASIDCKPYCPIVAAVYRSPYLAIAIVNGDEVLEVLRTRIRDRSEIRELVETAARQYGCRMLVLEPDPQLLKSFKGVHCSIRTLAIAEVKRLLIPNEKRKTNDRLFLHLVDRHPQLRRFVTIFPTTGRIAQSERWRLVQLFPVALGLAASQLKLGKSVGSTT